MPITEISRKQQIQKATSLMVLALLIHSSTCKILYSTDISTVNCTYVFSKYVATVQFVKFYFILFVIKLTSISPTC
jgi:hypothetical protein